MVSRQPGSSCTAKTEANRATVTLSSSKLVFAKHDEVQWLPLNNKNILPNIHKQNDAVDTSTAMVHSDYSNTIGNGKLGQEYSKSSLSSSPWNLSRLRNRWWFSWLIWGWFPDFSKKTDVNVTTPDFYFTITSRNTVSGAFQGVMNRCKSKCFRRRDFKKLKHLSFSKRRICDTSLRK